MFSFRVICRYEQSGNAARSPVPCTLHDLLSTSSPLNKSCRPISCLSSKVNITRENIVNLSTVVDEIRYDYMIR